MAKVYCTADGNAKQHFYVEAKGKSYYLFSQDFRKGVQNYYASGVDLNRALDVSKAKFDAAIARTMRKLPSHLRYIEKEYDVQIFNRTKKQFA